MRYGARVAPRIAPGTRRDIGPLNFALTRAIGAATGGGPPNLFTTLARHRGLFRRWLLFAGGLMPGGKLPRADTELVILRVAHNTSCEYEWRHHERIARLAGLAAEDVERARLAPSTEGWSVRQAAILRAADELHADGQLSDEVWDELRPLLSDRELIELCLLVGHYEMLAMTLNSLRVEPDPAPRGRPTRAMRLVRSIMGGKRGNHG
jgi:AhpD family alkylhydroperoxidase